MTWVNVPGAMVEGICFCGTPVIGCLFSLGYGDYLAWGWFIDKFIIESARGSRDRWVFWGDSLDYLFWSICICCFSRSLRYLWVLASRRFFSLRYSVANFSLSNLNRFNLPSSLLWASIANFLIFTFLLDEGRPSRKFSGSSTLVTEAAWVLFGGGTYPLSK